MDDLISRRAALDCFHDWIDKHGNAYCADESEEYQRIEALPSASQWIPCSKRLPENECKEYWVCTDTGYQCECRWTNVNPIWTGLTTDWHWNIFDTPQYTKVVAWMPLPEPYKGEVDE